MTDTTKPQAHVAVVGAGIAGLAAARVLINTGIQVDVFDMGENPGGRLATRDLFGPPWPGHIVDVGAAYFTVNDAEFASQVQQWQEQGLAHEWSDSYAVLEESQLRTARGRMRWSAKQGLRSLARAEVEFIQQSERGAAHFAHRVASVGVAGQQVQVDGVAYDGAILACPPPQALRMLDADTPTVLHEQLQGSWNPVISHTMVFAQRVWDDHGLWFVNGSDDLTSIADDGRRRGDGAAVLVAHSTPNLARAHFDEPESAAPALTQAVSNLLGIADAPVATITKRWGLAQPESPASGDFAADVTGRLLVCGDAWGTPARIEGAWLSGRRAAQALLTTLLG